MKVERSFEFTNRYGVGVKVIFTADDTVSDPEETTAFKWAVAKTKEFAAVIETSDFHS